MKLRLFSTAAIFWSVLIAVEAVAPVRIFAQARSNTAVSVTQEPFGKTADGKPVTLFTCTNRNGLTLKVTDYGAYVTAVETPDRNGKLANVTLGFKTLDEYLKHKAHFGGTVGRFANRIEKGKFSLDGHNYQLATNNGPNHLHGGPRGFDFLVWSGAPIETADQVGVKFTLHSPDGDEGYPGALAATVSYTLNNANELRMEYSAETDKPTIVNLTNHCYWNLAGAGDILGHEVLIVADRYLPVDATAIPTGQLAPVAGTVMDFRRSHKVGDRIAETDNGPGNPKGYDHCYVLKEKGDDLMFAARVKDPQSGRVMEISTTEPGIQFYTGNFLNGDPINGGYRQHAALCLEAEHFPDAPNRPEFATTVLRPGQKYHQLTVHKFLVE
jgi:aldose 1-epimerase